MKNKKWYYYGFKEIEYVWKQKQPLKGNPSTEYHLWILDKKEAEAIAKQNGIKIIKNGIINLKPIKMGKKDKKSKDKEKKGKDKKSTPKAGDLGAIRNFTGSLALTKLQHVIMKKKGKNGKVEGLFIPIDNNYFVRGKDGAVYMNIRVRTTENKGQYDDNGFIAHAAPSSVYKDAKKKEKEKMNNLPILGNIKDWESSGGGNDNSGAAASSAIEEDDDLPF